MSDGQYNLLRFPRPFLDPRSDEETANDINDELSFHISQLEREMIEAGESHEDAPRLALERFGDIEAIRKTCYRIARKEHIMLQKINLVLMIVVLLAVVLVSIQMLVTQKYNSLAIQSITAKLAAMSVFGDAKDSSKIEDPGVVYISGQVTNPGVYPIPASGNMNLLQLLTTSSGNILKGNTEYLVTIERTENNQIKYLDWVFESLNSKTYTPPQLKPDDTVTVARLREKDINFRPIYNSSSDSSQLGGTWQQVDENDILIPDGMVLEVKSTSDMYNLSNFPTGVLQVPGIDNEIPLTFNRGTTRSNLIIERKFVPVESRRPGGSDGRWALDYRLTLGLNLSNLIGADETYSKLRFVRIMPHSVAGTIAQMESKTDDNSRVAKLSEIIQTWFVNPLDSKKYYPLRGAIQVEELNILLEKKYKDSPALYAQMLEITDEAMDVCLQKLNLPKELSNVEMAALSRDDLIKSINNILTASRYSSLPKLVNQQLENQYQLLKTALVNRSSG